MKWIWNERKLSCILFFDTYYINNYLWFVVSDCAGNQIEKEKCCIIHVTIIGIMCNCSNKYMKFVFLYIRHQKNRYNFCVSNRLVYIYIYIILFIYCLINPKRSMHIYDVFDIVFSSPNSQRLVRVRVHRIHLKAGATNY